MSERKWLSEKRIAKQLVQIEVAKKAKIARAYYAQIEIGTRQPSVSVAKRIGEVLNFDWTLFFENKCSILIQKDLIRSVREELNDYCKTEK